MPTSKTFQIEGMDCAEEVAILRRELGPLVGGDEALSFDVLNGRMTVTSNDERSVDAAAVVAAVAKTGMRAKPVDSAKTTPPAEGDSVRRRLTILTTASGTLTLIGFVVHALSVDSLKWHTVQQ